MKQVKRDKKKKGKLIQFLEYGAAYFIITFLSALPSRLASAASGLLGNLLYLLMPARRRIAIENLRNAFDGEKSEYEIDRIARLSCKAFFLTTLEIIKSQSVFKSDNVMTELDKYAEGLDELFRKAKRIHDESKGCIFVTPHIGNWELLPHLCSIADIPLVVVVRPLDNPYLERLIYKNRAESGQVIIPKKNALFTLQKTLTQGKSSIGMLPDQATMQGISVDFFGRKAYTTPIPSMLSITYKRPIVVVACCRRTDAPGFEGIVSDPIWPGEFTSEKAEIFRLTEEMNKSMELIIRRYPEQYLWVHNRWKSYANKKGFMEE